MPAENYINGSYARPVTHLVVEPWTVYAFIGSTGSIIFLVMIGLLYTMLAYEIPPTSSFSIINDFRIHNDKSISDKSLNEAFNNKDYSNDWKIMDEAVKHSITLK